MEVSNISFIIRATFDVLSPPPMVWRRPPLCPIPATPKHILFGSKTSLTQGHYTWMHNQVLKCLAAVLESKRQTINSLPLRATNSIMTPTFIQEGQNKPNHPLTKPERLEDASWYWPATTTLGPDLVLWSPSFCLYHKAQSSGRTQLKRPISKKSCATQK